MPFLYLPDAISLALLLLALTLLRRCASLHLRRELQALRLDLIECWGSGSASVTPACLHLTREIDYALEHCEQMSPARLLFVERALKSAPTASGGFLLLESMSGLEPLLCSANDPKVRQKLRRIEMQIHTNLGVFCLLASISGWLLGIRILVALIRRALSSHPKDRIDWLFDMMERVFIHHGRRAHKLALLTATV